jgi:hypothetical protein
MVLFELDFENGSVVLANVVLACDGLFPSD